jgi:hypothetical protein
VKGGGTSRRGFLRLAAFGAGALALPAAGAALAARRTGRRKLVVVVFGGGLRASESIDDPTHRYVPRLWRDLRPRGALFTDMRVEGKVVHPNSTGSIVTGHWEWDDLDWSRPVAHPTIFEILRRERSAPDTAAWAFVYASILAQAGVSRAPGYGAAFGANVIEPPTIPRAAAEEMEILMRRAAARGSAAAEVEAARACARLARGRSTVAEGGLRSDAARAFARAQFAAWRGGAGSTSHDEFLCDRAVACMGAFAPEVVVVAFGEIDCAHYGSWSRYVEAIRRTDELTFRLWRAAERLPAYRGQTLLLVLPDHGRELERPGGDGFVHHGDFYTGAGTDEGCRRVWLLALGPGLAAGRSFAAPHPITSVAATGLEWLGLSASPGAAPSVLALARAGGRRG